MLTQPEKNCASNTGTKEFPVQPEATDPTKRKCSIEGCWMEATAAYQRKQYCYAHWQQARRNLSNFRKNCFKDIRTRMGVKERE